MNDTGFSIEGWDEFVENFSELVDKWEDKKKNTLTEDGNYLPSINNVSCTNGYLYFNW